MRLAATVVAAAALVGCSPIQFLVPTTEAPESIPPPTLAAPTTEFGGGPGTTTPQRTGGAVSPSALVQSVVQIRLETGGETVAIGSGSVISDDGLVLTNAHVADPRDISIDSLTVATTTSADLPPEPQWLAEVVAADHVLDLAVIRITEDLAGWPYPPGHIPPVEVGDSDSVEIGDDLYILGYPAIGGDTITFTRGLVAGFTGDSQLGTRAWIKTDAAISGGNSGGLAANAAGQLIGVPTIAGVGEDQEEIVDCRPVRDTNRDGVIDDNDDCVPLGGFLNGLRPSNLARDLIAAAESSTPYEPIGGLTVEEVDPAFDVSGAYFGAPFFTDSEPEPSPEFDSVWFPSDTRKLCAWWEFEGMTDGVEWDAIWAVGGDIRYADSFIGETWSAGEAGSMWVCTAEHDPLPEGIWDLALSVEGEWLIGSYTSVGDAYLPYEVGLRNRALEEICWLWISPQLTPFHGPAWVVPEEPIRVGQTLYLELPPTSYDVLAQNCSDKDIHSGSFVVDGDVDVDLGG